MSMQLALLAIHDVKHRKPHALCSGNGMKNAFHSLSNLSYDLNADSICNFKFSKEDREKQQEDLIGN